MTEIYVTSETDDIVLVEPQPYDSEDVLQQLIAANPALLAGRQMGGVEPRRWRLIGREIGVPKAADGPDWFSLDHLFIDQDAVLTLVEVKRVTDTRIRREVVGQMLDYAANAASYWQIDRLKTLAGPLDELVAPDDEDAFWQTAEENLRAGRVRLVFLADEIPIELERIIEFLNEHLTNADVFGVAVAKYVGGGVNVYVPRVVGQTTRALDKQGAADPRSFDELLAAASDEFRQCVSLIDGWAREHGLAIGTARRSRKIVRDGTSILWAYPGSEAVQPALPVLDDGPDGTDRRAAVANVLATTFGARQGSPYPMLSPADVLADWPAFRSGVLDAFLTGR